MMISSGRIRPRERWAIMGNRTSLRGADWSYLEGRGSEDPDCIRESSADL